MRSLNAMIKNFFIILCIICVSFFCIGSVHAETLTVSHQWTGSKNLFEGDYRDRVVKFFAQLVEERTGGELKFQIHNSASLYKPKQQLDALQRGELDFALYPLVYGTGRVPQWDIVLMPGLPIDHFEGTRWRYNPIGKEIAKSCEKHGFKIITWVWNRGGIGTKGKPVILPKDAKDMKFRATGKHFEYMLNEGCGASIQSMPSTEIYFALQTGALDGAFTGNETFKSFNLYEQIDYYTTTKNIGIFNTATPLVVSMKTFEELSSEYQNIILEAGKEAELFSIQEGNKADEEVLEVLEKNGVELHHLTEEEYMEWYKVAEETAHRKFSEDVDGGKQLLEMAKDVMLIK